MNTILMEDLQARGLIHQTTAAIQLPEHLQSAPRYIYCGFDPTASSLHLGHLVPLLMLRRFQIAGHHPLMLIGGATGLIGDPSFKARERQLNSEELVSRWSDAIKKQASRFLDFDCKSNPAQAVNNIDWMQSFNLIDFLRTVGKHFSINSMVQKEAVQQRLQREGSGLSFTEFSYALLQGYDFLQLNKQYQCTLQVGGSDQWGNIVGGIDLIRRQQATQAYGLTVPLITKADGTKFGKTASGTVWLDSDKTSPYRFYQFWLNTNDQDLYRFLKFFTFLPIDQIAQIEAEDEKATQRKAAQTILASEVTELVHGKEALDSVKRITQALFSNDTHSLQEQEWQQLKQDGLPFAQLRSEHMTQPLTTLLSECGLVNTGREVKDALARNAVWINNEVKTTADNLITHEHFSSQKAYYGRYFLVKLGKKKHFLFEYNSNT